MATMNFKSSSTLKDSGPVFQDGLYPSWLPGVESDASSLFSDRLSGKPYEKVNGRYIAMMHAHASYPNLYSTENNNDYDDYLLSQHPSKSTNYPLSQTQDCYDDRMKSYQHYYNTQPDFRNRKFPDVFYEECDDDTKGYTQPPMELIKTVCNSSKGVYRLSYNTPIPKNNLMPWRKSDIQLLNQFTGAASSNHSSNLHSVHKTSLQKQSGYELKQRKMVLLDLQANPTDEKQMQPQHHWDSLLTYDPRWTFGESAENNTEISSNNGKTLPNTYPKWESNTDGGKSVLKLEDEKSSFSSSRLHSIYSTNNSTPATLAKETSSAITSVRDQDPPSEQKDIVKDENQILNQEIFDSLAKQLYDGLNTGPGKNCEHQESPQNKISDSETSSTDSSSSRFYFSSKPSIHEKSQIHPIEKCSSSSSSDYESTPYLPNSDRNTHSSHQKCKTAKPHAVIKSINELLENPYENSECVFCKGNDQTEEVYLSHPIRVDNIVVCPYLRKYVCAICKSTGDGAHTIKYCPFNKRGFFAMREKFPPPNKSIRPLDQDTNLNSLKKGKIVQNIWKPKSPRFELDNEPSLCPTTLTLSTTSSSCYSDVVSSNRLFFQNLEKLRKNPKKQDIGCRST